MRAAEKGGKRQPSTYGSSVAAVTQSNRATSRAMTAPDPSVEATSTWDNNYSHSQKPGAGMALAALNGVRATMDEIGEHAWIISIVGDFLILFGAYWTARAELLAPEQAAGIAVGRWDNEPLKNALLKQSSDARIGLMCVAVGAGFQIVSKLIEEFFS